MKRFDGLKVIRIEGRLVYGARYCCPSNLNSFNPCPLPKIILLVKFTCGLTN